MKKILVPAIGAVLSGLLITAAYAGENNGTGQKDAMQSARTGTGIQPSQKQDAASRYSKSKIERNKRAREKSSALKSGGAGTVTVAPSTSGTSVVERDKKRYAIQKRAADRRAVELKKADKARKPAASGSSVVERDKKRYDAQKRAADRRAAEMKKADMASTTTDTVK
jgi:hypothetical protein